jgi:MFS family permease
MFSMLRNRDFGLLWLAGLISMAGDTALVIALPLHIYRLTDSTLATSGVIASTLLPRVLFGSFAGVFADRWDRKRVMMFSDLSRAIILLPLLLVPDHLILVYAIAAAQGILGLCFSPAESAMLPTLVGEDKLVQANALNSLNDNLAMLIGPPLGAFLYAFMGIGGAALYDSVTYAGSAILLGLIVADTRPKREVNAEIIGSQVKHILSEWRAGLSIVRRDQSLRVVFVSRSLANIAEGVFLTLGISPLVLDVLGGTPSQVGWPPMAQAIGGMLAGVVVIRIGHRLSKRWLFGGGMVGLGLCDFSTFNAFRFAAAGTPAVVVAMGFMTLAGIPAVAGGAGSQTIVQEQTTDAYRGRVFGALSSISGVAMVAGLAIGGVLGDRIGLFPVLSASAMVRVVGGIVALVFLPRQAVSTNASVQPTYERDPELPVA